MSRGLIFPYKQTGQRYRPLIPIELKHGGQSVRYEALVDSGADICIFPGDIGRAIGLDIAAGEPFVLGGVTREQRTGYFHKVTFTIGKHSYMVKVGFMDTMREDAFGMLGQKGFFDRFAIKFDYAERKVVLHKKPWV